jgi:hypothetical protein
MSTLTITGEPTLDQARQQFLTAEQEFQAAAEALRRLQLVTEQMDATREVLGQAAGTLNIVERDFSAAAAAFQNACGDLRRGVDNLGQADPARLRADFEAFSGTIRSTLTELQQTMAEFSQRVETSSAELGTRMTTTVSSSQQSVTAQLADSQGNTQAHISRLMDNAVTSLGDAIKALGQEHRQTIAAATAALRGDTEVSADKTIVRLEAKIASLQGLIQEEQRERVRLRKEPLITTAIATAVIIAALLVINLTV